MSEVTKRTVSTDALETLGTIIDDKQKRDAIHLAVLPVVAGEPLNPGEEIVLSSNGEAMGADMMGGLAIVDPFLSKKVRTGERFWMVLKPRLVTSLRHTWSHPAFPDESAACAAPADAKEAAMAAIQRIAGSCGMTADRLIEGAVDYLDSDDYISTGSLELDLPDEFWDHFETVTGRTVESGSRGSFFSCSC